MVSEIIQGSYNSSTCETGSPAVILSVNTYVMNFVLFFLYVLSVLDSLQVPACVSPEELNCTALVASE